MWINPQIGAFYRGMAALRAAYPQVCIPAALSEDSLAFLGLAPVVAVAPPEYDPYTADLVEEPPELVDGVWVQQWRVAAAPAAEVAARGLARRGGLTATPRQARLALKQAGLLTAVAAWIAQADETTRIEWEFALEVRRDWPPILACGAALGLSEAQLDALFAQAATL